MNYIDFSRKFFAATGIPVDLLCEGRPVYSSLGELIRVPIMLALIWNK